MSDQSPEKMESAQATQAELQRLRLALKPAYVQERPVLDHGYLGLVEYWGSDERIVEAARMSTSKGFQGWGPKPCPRCEDREVIGPESPCPACKGSGKVPGDERLLAYLWKNGHTSPFEQAGFTVEVKAPIFVFREWHRHRTQSYNEMSGRYVALPDENYFPTVERCLLDGGMNKQAQSLPGAVLGGVHAEGWLQELRKLYDRIEDHYQLGLALGLPKELARLPVPVARYSKMRSSANLWNWLRFLKLRCASNAQWEIRQYADAVALLVEQLYPRTWELFKESF